MDEKTEVERIVDITSIDTIIATTVPLIVYLRENNVRFSEKLLKTYLVHAMSCKKIKAQNKEKLKPYLHDFFAYNANLILEIDEVVETPKTIEEKSENKTILPNDGELTPEMIAKHKAELGLPSITKQEPSQFFLDLQELLGGKDE